MPLRFARGQNFLQNSPGVAQWQSHAGARISETDADELVADQTEPMHDLPWSIMLCRMAVQCDER